jgi:hypothetical protein
MLAGGRPSLLAYVQPADLESYRAALELCLMRDISLGLRTLGVLWDTVPEKAVAGILATGALSKDLSVALDGLAVEQFTAITQHGAALLELLPTSVYCVADNKLPNIGGSATGGR